MWKHLLIKESLQQVLSQLSSQTHPGEGCHRQGRVPFRRGFNNTGVGRRSVGPAPSQGAGRRPRGQELSSWVTLGGPLVEIN